MQLCIPVFHLPTLVVTFYKTGNTEPHACVACKCLKLQGSLLPLQEPEIRKACVLSPKTEEFFLWITRGSPIHAVHLHANAIRAAPLTHQPINITSGRAHQPLFSQM